MATRNYVPRANGEGSIGTEKKHWGGAFFDKLAVKTLEVIGGGTENDAQPATVGWVKRSFSKMLETVLNATGTSYSITPIGYIKFGALFGGLIIQWGYVQVSNSYTLPVAFAGKGSYIGVASSDALSGGNVGFTQIDGQTIKLIQEPGKESYRTYLCIGR